MKLWKPQAFSPQQQHLSSFFVLFTNVAALLLLTSPTPPISKDIHTLGKGLLCFSIPFIAWSPLPSPKSVHGRADDTRNYIHSIFSFPHNSTHFLSLIVLSLTSHTNVREIHEWSSSDSKKKRTRTNSSREWEEKKHPRQPNKLV